MLGPAIQTVPLLEVKVRVAPACVVMGKDDVFGAAGMTAKTREPLVVSESAVGTAVAAVSVPDVVARGTVMTASVVPS